MVKRFLKGLQTKIHFRTYLYQLMRKKTPALNALNKLHTSTEFFFNFFILRQSTYAMFNYDVTSGKNTECNIKHISSH